MVKFDADTLRWWVENPEEAARRTAEADLTLWNMTQALEVYRGGDRRALRTFFEDYMGHKTDALAWSAVTSRMPNRSEDLLVRPFLVFLKIHGERLDRRREAEGVEPWTEDVRRGIRKNTKLDVALALLARDREPHEVVLRDNVPGAAYAEQGELSFEDSLPARVANQIVRDAVESPDKRREAIELAAFAEQEAVLKRGRDVKLPPREYELFKFFVHNPGATNAQAARALGIAIGTVKSLKHRIKNTPNIA